MSSKIKFSRWQKFWVPGLTGLVEDMQNRYSKEIQELTVRLVSCGQRANGYSRKIHKLEDQIEHHKRYIVTCQDRIIEQNEFSRKLVNNETTWVEREQEKFRLTQLTLAHKHQGSEVSITKKIKEEEFHLIFPLTPSECFPKKEVDLTPEQKPVSDLSSPEKDPSIYWVDDETHITNAGIYVKDDGYSMMSWKPCLPFMEEEGRIETQKQLDAAKEFYRTLKIQ